MEHRVELESRVYSILFITHIGDFLRPDEESITRSVG